MFGSPKSVYVDAATLRQRFRELNILGMLARGELRQHLDEDYLAPATSGQPTGTRGHRVMYYRDEVLIAVVHQYLLPDGTIGASGLPDPKWLRDGDTIFKYRLSEQP